MCKESNNTSSSSSRYVVFRYGKLLFGFHGLLGILCIIITILGIIYPYMIYTIIIPSQICNFILINDAYNLLGQVPISTQIFHNVIAPHKEAFQRTIWVMQYLIIRTILKCCISQQHDIYRNNFMNQSNIMYMIKSILIIWRYYPLIPNYRMDIWNGNTWIFVIPIFLGVSGDIYVYFIYGDIFEIYHLLLGELLGLLLAFGFTLGFRNYIPMPIVYTSAAFAVWAIIQQGIITVNDDQ